MMDADWTDDSGRVIVEPLIPEPEPEEDDSLYDYEISVSQTE